MHSKSFMYLSASVALIVAAPAFGQSTTSSATGADGNHSPTISANVDLSLSRSSTDNSYNTSTPTDNSTETTNVSKTIDSNNTRTTTTSVDKADGSYNTANLARTDTTNVSKTIDSYNTDNSQANDNWKVVAVQDLRATTDNSVGLDFSGNRSNYSSGGNSIGGSAFAAYAGILNQGWNTGISSNTQAATNMAAQGTVNF